MKPPPWVVATATAAAAAAAAADAADGAVAASWGAPAAAPAIESRHAAGHIRSGRPNGRRAAPARSKCGGGRGRYFSRSGGQHEHVDGSEGYMTAA